MASAAAVRHTLLRMGPGLLAVLATVGLAAAEPARVPSVGDAAVMWSAPGGCPDDAAVEQRIATLVGEPPIPTPATVQVQHAGDHYVAQLVTWIDGSSQRRELAASTCSALADAVAVIVAVALDPMETIERAPAVRSSLQTAAQRDDRRGLARGDRIGADRGPREPLHFGFGFGAGYGTGIAPRGSAVTQLGFELGRTGSVLGWSVVLDTRVWLPRTFDRAATSIRTLLGTVGLLGCAKGLAGRVEVPVCLGVEAGGLRARGLDGFASQSERNASYPWVAPRLRVGVRVALGRRAGLSASGEAAAPLARARIDAGRSGAEPVELWGTRPVSLRVMLGVDFRWVR